MALDKESVKLGISILKQINKSAYTVKYETADRSVSYVDTNKIFCVGEKYDDGYENVFTNVENMTDEQRKLWKQLKGKVPNSSFINKLNEKDYRSFLQWVEEKDKDITCIGWF